MKKEGLLFSAFIVSIIFISLASATEIKLSKENYNPGETLQGEVYGNFIGALTVDNIHFYRDRNIPLDYDILKSGDKYLIYALLPYIEGNYTLKIEDSTYETETGTSSEDIVKEFTIRKTNESYFSFSPGFVVARDDFYITVRSNIGREINAEFLGETQNLSISQNKDEKIYFSVNGITNYTQTSIKLSGYEIPVFIYPNNSEVVEDSELRFNPYQLDIIMLPGQSNLFIVSLTNFGRTNLTDIELKVNCSNAIKVAITPETISELDEDQRIFVNITLNASNAGKYSGEIEANSGSNSALIKLAIEVNESASEINNTGNQGYQQELNCSQIGGVKCPLDYVCSVPSELTIDGYCCKGECKKSSSSGGSNSTLGIIIIILVFAGLIGFLYYMKKKQKKPMDILKEREKKFKDRMENKEVNDKLTRS
jgi:hypothetical protein